MTDQEFYVWCQSSRVGSRRQISLMLVEYCVSQKLYRDAAQIVSGSSDIFNSCSERINNLIASNFEVSGSVWHPDDMQSILDEAREEIMFYRLWENNVLGRLPDEDNAAPLIAAFRDSRKAGARLYHDVMTVSDKYFKASTTGYSLEQKIAVAPIVVSKEVCHE